MRSNVFLLPRGQVLAGQHKHGEICCPRITSPFGEQLESADFWKNKIEDDKFGQGRGHFRASLTTIGGDGYRIPVFAQQFSDELTCWGIIVDHQNSLRSSNPSAMVETALHGSQKSGLLYGLYDVLIRAEQGSCGWLIEDGDHNHRYGGRTWV